MPSIEIETLRSQHPGISDAEAAEAYAKENGYIAIVAYKKGSNPKGFTNIGCCRTADHLNDYMTSPYCDDAEIIYAEGDVLPPG